MKSARNSARIVVGMLAVLAMSLIGAAPASAESPTWTLQDIGQKVCVSTGGWDGTYVFAPVSGTWTTPITTGIRNLPPGSSDLGGSVLPPGSNDENTINGFVGVSFAPAPAGDYVAEVWASDGTVTQTAPVLLRYGAPYACW
ncbi:DUF5980 family protein [Actinomadura sp. WMMB 499]|uniref:DUF5980 family protein n=1 Tax=Actinomadura sp. WMMB 499 TaxID=1219491 RepID=UPI0012446F58|nr:DUF5980 family protein [Actinomadura sp. WMMB 499]QFG24932.1 hypothetical protein F7P10_31145 [Actinomadura sp. WMMB 499]